jgi:F0F1-type ATP synthase membrane subunit a
VSVEEEQAKQALKEALKEWMDEKFATVGKWSTGAVVTALIGMLVYFLLLSNGWQRIGH